jgi:aspartyl-tRNA(Asn)/glutamyl-tRNA(Gln) amidotransferase subunit A
MNAFGTIAELAPRLRAGELSPVTLMEETLDRIAKVDPGLHSYICLADDPLGAARDAASATQRGPLHGIPIAIKDNYLTEDMATTAGTAAPGVAFPRRDSTVVARLRAAGAILVGKTRTHEYAWGTVTPPVCNPWDRGRIPGGSSGGSAAAVAAGLCVAATGSDTGGSIRIPASFCGTVGLKPTFGRVSRAGIVPHSWSLDHPGPLTRSVEDAAILLGILAGHDPADPATLRAPVEDYQAATQGAAVGGMRVAVVRNHFFGRNQGDVEEAVERAIGWFGEQGATIRDVTVPNLAYGLGAIFAIELVSSSAYHDLALQDGRTRHYNPDVRLLVEMGRLVSGSDVIKAEQFRRVLMRDYARLFQDADIILGPTEPITAPGFEDAVVKVGADGEQESVLAATWRLTYPYNLTGLPAISVPCGFDHAGLPIGLQIVARPLGEAMVLRAAAAYEAAHEWRERRPAYA